MFDDGTFDLNQKEMNGKGFCTESYADSQLKDIPHKLYRGLSTETVPQFKRDYGRCVDFAFIDGGHSLDTILQDYENVCEVMNPGGIIVFDDYYTPEIKDFGCNQVVKDIPHEVLPHKDKFDKAIQLVKVIYGAE